MTGVRKVVRIDFARLAEIGNVGVRRAAAFLALGHKAWSDEALSSVSLPVPLGLRFLPDPLPAALSDEIRREFRVWITGNAIVEILQSLHLYFDEVYAAAVLLEAHGGRVEKSQVDRIGSFKADTNLASKIGRIDAETGLTAPLVKHLAGWVMARNALSHNHGIVRKRDCVHSGGSVLKMTWLRLDWLVNGEVIIPEDFGEDGFLVVENSTMGVRPAEGGVEFRINDVVALDERSILEICLTASFLVNELNKALSEYVGRVVGKSEGDGNGPQVDPPR